jgi:phosphopantothenoylcysteine synthetase/decarboxylase
MKCLVTAGPTYESLDQVRRLTNLSTGRLGSLLANFLVARGHEVTLLLGHYATHRGEQRAQTVETFTTTADLGARFDRHAGEAIGAVFHAAAISDFTFGKIFARTADGALTEVNGGKISTRQGTLLAELLPTPKLIGGLRGQFPQARIIGWKYEVDGDRTQVLDLARRQIREHRTNACVANGPAYGVGFGLVGSAGETTHFGALDELFVALATDIQTL